MDRTQYQRLLFKQAVLAMACDGEVHPDEVAEVRRLARTTPYFDAIDADSETETALADLRTHGSGAVRASIEQLREAELSAMQRFRVVEVVLNVVAADGAIEDEERDHVSSIREALAMTTEEAVVRFPSALSLLVSTGARGSRFESGAEPRGIRGEIDGLDSLSL